MLPADRRAVAAGAGRGAILAGGAAIAWLDARVAGWRLANLQWEEGSG